MKQDHIFSPEIETMPWEEIRKTQVEKLKKQLAYVYERADFYKRKFQAVGFEPGDFKTINDLSKIPFTEKKELRESQIEASIALSLYYRNHGPAHIYRIDRPGY